MNDTPAPGGLRRFIDCVFYAGCSSTEIDRRNTRRLNLTAFAWAASYIAAAWFLKGEYDLSLAAIAALIVACVGLGIAMLWSWVIFLRGTDELMRKVHLEAMAVGFGLMILAAITWSLLEAVDAPPLKLNYLIAVGAFVYSGGVMLGMRRYR